jgi:DNA repair exonuclease SbcCD ATPase subunit
LQQYLTGLQSAWQVYYERAVQDMKAGLEEIDSAAMLSLI